MPARAFRLAALAAVLLALTPAPAQTAAALRPTCYAVRDARVVVEPGTVLPKATVVVRDGLVAAVGPGVPVPPDAAVVDGAGLTVYPGFVDAANPRGYDPALRRSLAGPPAPEDMAADPLIATKPDHRKGLTPEFAAQTALTVDEDAAAPWRRAGFTAQLVAPDGGFLSGTSALVPADAPAAGWPSRVPRGVSGGPRRWPWPRSRPCRSAARSSGPSSSPWSTPGGRTQSSQ